MSAHTLAEETAATPSSRVSAPAGATRVLTLEAISGEAWDETISEFDGVCQEQLYAFSRNRWPGVTCEPVLFRDGEEIVGGALVMVQPLPLKLGHIAVSKWGPIFKDSARPDFPDIYAAAIEALLAEYDRKRHMMLSVLPRAAVGHRTMESDYLAGRGFRGGSPLLFPNRYIVNLRLDDEAQRKSFAQKWRYHLKKSEKAELTFENAPADRIGDFDALYQAMTDRKRFPDHSAYDDTITALMEIGNDTLRPELFFVRHEGEIIAGAVIFKAGDTAVYLYGATNDKALPLRAGYFLHWNIIRWLRDNTKAEWYDLGGTDGFQGLHQFKKGMVGDAGVVSPVPHVANYASHWRPFVTGTLAFGVRDGLEHVKRFIERVSPEFARPDQQR